MIAIHLERDGDVQVGSLVSIIKKSSGSQFTHQSEYFTYVQTVLFSVIYDIQQNIILIILKLKHFNGFSEADRFNQY